MHMSIGSIFVALSAYALLRFMYRNRALLVSKEQPNIRGKYLPVILIQGCSVNQSQALSGRFFAVFFSLRNNSLQ